MGMRRREKGGPKFMNGGGYRIKPTNNPKNGGEKEGKRKRERGQKRGEGEEGKGARKRRRENGGPASSTRREKRAVPVHTGVRRILFARHTGVRRIRERHELIPPQRPGEHGVHKSDEGNERAGTGAGRGGGKRKREGSAGGRGEAFLETGAMGGLFLRKTLLFLCLFLFLLLLLIIIIRLHLHQSCQERWAGFVLICMQIKISSSKRVREDEFVRESV